MENKEVKYWIIVASKDHVKTGITGGFAQACHGKAAPLQRMKSGDYVLYYSGKQRFGEKENCQKFTAIGRVKDEEVYSFQMNDNFCPFRRNIEFFKSKDISILPLIHNLTFIKNKNKWGYPFRYGFFEINQNDFEMISSQMVKYSYV